MTDSEKLTELGKRIRDDITDVFGIKKPLLVITFCEEGEKQVFYTSNIVRKEALGIQRETINQLVGQLN